MNRTSRRALLACWPLGLLLGLWASSAAASAPPGRYVIPGDGTVHDTKTGLVWQQAVAPGTYTWTQAGSYCGSLGLASGGWRLPSVKELLTLVDFTVASGPTIDGTAFPGTPSALFWSSSPPAGYSSIGSYVDFSSGTSGYYTVPPPAQARCVR